MKVVYRYVYVLYINGAIYDLYGGEAFSVRQFRTKAEALKLYGKKSEKNIRRICIAEDISA